MSKVMVISPGVLPLPPVLGGAVENLIARLHGGLSDTYEMEYVSVKPPETAFIDSQNHLRNAKIHYIDSINPLEDFNFSNMFELQESSKWTEYRDFCIEIAKARQPELLHIHNEAHLAPALREALPNARILLHVNDEVVTRMSKEAISTLGKSCDLILPCSKYISEAISQAFQRADIPKPSIEVFYNFVDTQEYDPENIDLRMQKHLRDQLSIGTAPVILFVGRLIEQKGPHLALRAFQYLKKSSIETPILLFVGAPWYSRSQESAFVRAIREEGKKDMDKLRFSGYIDHSLMPNYYSIASVVCIPSIWDDPSPFVSYEAQAMAKPVIASTRGGLPEIVKDGVSGRCIDPFNTLLFADILKEWLLQPSTASEIGQSGRLRVKEEFSLGKAREKMRSLYARLLRS